MAVNLYLQANLCPEIIHSLSKCFLLQCNLEYLEYFDYCIKTAIVKIETCFDFISMNSVSHTERCVY